MAIIDVSSSNGILKDVYSKDEIKDLWNKENVTINKIKKTNERFDGAKWVLNHGVLGAERGIGSSREKATLREGGVSTNIKPEVTEKTFYARGEITGQDIEKGKTDAGAFAKVLTYNIDQVHQLGMKELNCQLFRNGLGRLAQVNGAVSAGTTVTFDNGHATHIRENMYIDIYNGSTREVDSALVTSVDSINNTFTVSAAITASDNSYIYREDTFDTTTTGIELDGLPKGSDDGTDFPVFQGITIATYPQYKGLVANRSSANFSLDFILQMDERSRTRGGKVANVVISHPAQQRKYIDLVVPHIEYKKGDGDYGIGLDSVPKVVGKSWFTDIDCPRDVVYGMNWDSIELGELFPYGPDTRSSGGGILRDTNRQDVFEFRHTFYGNVIFKDRRDFWRNYGLATPSA